MGWVAKACPGAWTWGYQTPSLGTGLTGRSEQAEVISQHSVGASILKFCFQPSGGQ